MKKISLTFLTCISCLFLLLGEVNAKSQYDLDKPFGFATRSSRTESSATFSLTGGGTFVPVTGSNVKVLKSTGKDMAQEIIDAVTNPSFDVVIFDGSKGDFLISSLMRINNVKNKTILGINGAKLCTQWHLTKELIDILNNAGVPDMNTSGGGSTLVNGTMVREEAEYNTRRIIIETTGDTLELYRNSGIFSFAGCDNIVIRNLELHGPGSIDVGGSDLLSIIRSTHMWVDHCAFYDGMDGNFDITQSSDFITVSWCSFQYSEYSYMHQNTNLVGYSDRETPGFLNITFAFNNWGPGCRARMPMGRIGKIHMLNNYYTCKGNATACINPRINSEFLIEGNYIDPAIKTYFSQKDAVAWVWADSNIAPGKPQSKGTVTMPYSYTVMDATLVPEEVSKNVGPTLFTNK